MTAPDLTARGVKTMLTRAGVDYSRLQIHASPIWSATTNSYFWTVTISGPSSEQRTAAFRVLFDRGLKVAPYPDRDEWSRP